MLLLVLFKSTDRFQFHNLSLETMMKTGLVESGYLPVRLVC